MAKFKNRIGDRYGRLTVIEYAGKDHRGKHLWLCKCDCGNTKVVVSDNLSSGKSKSCGCLLKEFLYKKGNQYGLYEDREDAILKVQYSHLKRRHKKRFNSEVMSYEDFKNKSKKSCFYCGLPYSKILEDRLNETKTLKRLSETVVKINGIDRIDSEVGYTKENTVPCCKYCNTAKNTMSYNEFIEWIKRVYKHSITVTSSE